METAYKMWIASAQDPRQLWWVSSRSHSYNCQCKLCYLEGYSSCSKELMDSNLLKCTMPAWDLVGDKVFLQLFTMLKTHLKLQSAGMHNQKNISDLRISTEKKRELLNIHPSKKQWQGKARKAEPKSLTRVAVVAGLKMTRESMSISVVKGSNGFG